jgi:hypothetical protein
MFAACTLKEDIELEFALKRLLYGVQIAGSIDLIRQLKHK